MTFPIVPFTVQSKLYVSFTTTISTNQLELNLRTYLLSVGWNGRRPVIATIAPNIYIWSNNTANAALNMGGEYPGGLTIINKGFIMGSGGNGANAVYADAGFTISPQNGGAGGPAINLTGPATIDNTNGYIGGGGGGGGVGHKASIFGTNAGGGGGGGAGGGLGGISAIYSAGSFVPGSNGPGGAIGQGGGTSFANPQGLTTAYVVYPTHGGAGGYGGLAGANTFPPI